ncbi:MAG: formyltransferase family protein [Candidatus Omnitrophica bacterium]|nr:formyltransferase family protein [Candidatus Omnitrophota bacterium]
MKIVFIGTVEFSKKVLTRLIERGNNVVSVITLKRSGFNADHALLSGICRRNKIHCFFADDRSEKEITRYVRGIRPDLILCVGWSRLLSKELVSVPRLGVVGYHPALLPRNRGRHPLIWALALGLRETGSTFFMMDAKADSGDIISQRKISICYSDNARSLYDKVARTAIRQIDEIMEQFENGTINRIQQRHSHASYWKRRYEQDGVIDWRMPSGGIYNLVRALTRPYVGAHFLRRGKKITVWKAAEVTRSGVENCEPGKVLAVYKNGSFVVKTGSDCIRVLERDPHVTIKTGEYL